MAKKVISVPSNVERSAPDGFVTYRNLDTNSAQNSGLPDKLNAIVDEAHEVGRTFDLNQSITTIDQLKQALAELIIRFDTKPDYYTKKDYQLLIGVLANGLNFLYNYGCGEEELRNQIISIISELNLVSDDKMNSAIREAVTTLGSSLQDQLDALKSALRKDIDANTESIVNIETKISSIDQNINSINQSLNSQSSAIDQLKQTVVHQGEDIESLKDKIEEISIAAADRIEVESLEKIFDVIKEKDLAVGVYEVILNKDNDTQQVYTLHIHADYEILLNEEGYSQSAIDRKTGEEFWQDWYKYANQKDVDELKNKPCELHWDYGSSFDEL